MRNAKTAAPQRAVVFVRERACKSKPVDALTACEAADYARREFRSIVSSARLSSLLLSSWLDCNGGFERSRRYFI
jgi:hypothetical protein